MHAHSINKGERMKSNTNKLDGRKEGMNELPEGGERVYNKNGEWFEKRVREREGLINP